MNAFNLQGALERQSLRAGAVMVVLRFTHKDLVMGAGLENVVSVKLLISKKTGISVQPSGSAPRWLALAKRLKAVSLFSFSLSLAISIHQPAIFFWWRLAF